MPTHAGPNTFGEENLVFGYDLGDVVNSFSGIPAVNCATVPTSGFNWTVTEVTDGSIVPPRSGARVFKFVCNNASNLHRQGGYYNGGGFGGGNPTPLILGRTSPSNFTTVGTGKYRFGMWVRGSANNSAASWTIDIGDRNGASLTVNNNTNWQFISTTDASGIASTSYPYDFFDINGTNGQTYYVADYGIFRSPGTVDNLPALQAFPQWVDFQQERIYTQGLLPLVGNSTIDLTSVSFDSTAQMVFDGTDDSMVVSNNSALKNNNTSIELVIKYLNTPNGDIIQFGVGSGTYAQYYYRAYSGNSYWNWYPVGTGYGDITIPNEALPLNRYHHIVMTGNDQGYVQFYINGVLQTGATRTANSQPANWTPADLTVGGFSWDGYSSSEVPYLKIYSRILPASEIQQNFNAIKSRFNI